METLPLFGTFNIQPSLNPQNPTMKIISCPLLRIAEPPSLQNCLYTHTPCLPAWFALRKRQVLGPGLSRGPWRHVQKAPCLPSLLQGSSWTSLTSVPLWGLILVVWPHTDCPELQRPRVTIQKYSRKRGRRTGRLLMDLATLGRLSFISTDRCPSSSSLPSNPHLKLSNLGFCLQSR